MKVSFSQAAKIDLENIGDWIAKDNPMRAVPFVRELRMSCEAIVDFPNAWPLMPHYEISNIRRKVHGSYLIFYVVAEVEITVIHILHGSRDFERLLGEPL